MLAHQKSRVAMLNKKEKPLEGDNFTDILGKFDEARFEQVMAGYEPADNFERNLALGVLEHSDDTGPD